MGRRGASRAVARKAAGGWRGRVGRCCVDWRAGLAVLAMWPVSLAGGRGQAAGSIADPFRQTAVSVGKNTHFSRELDPLRQFNWV